MERGLIQASTQISQRLMLTFIALFLLPAMASAALITAYRGGRRAGATMTARRARLCRLPPPTRSPGAGDGWPHPRLERRGGAAPWIVIKLPMPIPGDAMTWSVGGSPRTNYWGPDICRRAARGRARPGATAEALIPRIEPPSRHTATPTTATTGCGRARTATPSSPRSAAVPEIGVALPSNAIGRDFARCSILASLTAAPASRRALGLPASSAGSRA